MTRLPTLIASSVIRGTQLGESHGGLYLVDLQNAHSELKLDWNRTDIDVSGRGGDRGLRGIAFYRQNILVAANAEILFLTTDFRCQEVFSNPYLRHAHELSVLGNKLFVTSTGYDSILMFDLEKKRFEIGLHLVLDGGQIQLRTFDPSTTQGPAPNRQFHINSVKAQSDGVYVGGVRLRTLLKMTGQGLQAVAALPAGTHNAQPLGDGMIYNDTAADRVCYQRTATAAPQFMPVPRFARDQILNIERFHSSVARPHFARGLCSLENGLIAAGSSPSTIGLYRLSDGERLAQHNISMDVRNAIHGLNVWPF
jgi:hypothetical protein